MSDAVNRLRAQVEAPGLRPLAAGLQISLADGIELLRIADILTADGDDQNKEEN